MNVCDKCGSNGSVYSVFGEKTYPIQHQTIIVELKKSIFSVNLMF